MTIITVMNGNDNGAGSLRAALAEASAGDIINFAFGVTTVVLDSSLVISKNVTIEGSLVPGTSGVTIEGGGSNSNFSDFTINAGVTAAFDGLIIEKGHATGAAGSYGASSGGTGGTGGGAAGGIYDAGTLTLTNTILENDSAIGGAGGTGGLYNGGGGAGGSAAGGIYVASTGAVYLASSDHFSADTATGGAGGRGGATDANGYILGGGSGGAGGHSGVNGGVGTSGNAGVNPYGGGGGTGGAPGLAGSSGTPGGGGGGGAAFATVGGQGLIGQTSGVVTNNSDSANTVGSLRYELAHVIAGGTITFASNVTTIDLTASLVIAKNVTIEGLQPGSTTPGVTINGGGSGSNFADFTIDAGVTATLDGLIIADGQATGATGAAATSFGDIGTTGYAGGTGGGAAGGIYDAGTLTLTNSVLQNDTATGGTGGTGYTGRVHTSPGGADLIYGGTGGGAGGNAAGAIYVAHNGALNLAASDSFGSNSAVGGTGGQGGGEAASSNDTDTLASGGRGGFGDYASNGGVSTGFAGQSGSPPYGGAGGAPGQPGVSGTTNAFFESGVGTIAYDGAAGGGGGGTAFGDVGGRGTISLTSGLVTSTSDSINTFGSLRYELAHIAAGGTITFASNITTIDLTSSLVIAKNVTIEGLQAGSTTPGVTINGGGSGSNFSDFIIETGVTATLDGLIIADGHTTGAAGAASTSFGDIGTTGFAGGTGGNAGGGIYDAGTLTLTNSVLRDDTATGGAGGTGYTGRVHTSPGGADLIYGGTGGGAGGNAAGGIYVAHNGTLNLAASDSFSSNSAFGGNGGQGGAEAASSNDTDTLASGGLGGLGGFEPNGISTGLPGRSGAPPYGGAGGAPGQPGVSGTTSAFFEPGVGTIAYDGAAGGGGGGNAFADFGGTGTINEPAPCYCPGTRIRTAHGEKRVEKLKIGDEVRTASGALRPIKWIGRRSYAGRFVRGDKNILPICIRAGALDDNVPKRDLWLSPHHAMYLKGVLIEAKDLINGVSIVQAEQVEAVDYFHIELDTHDVIIAEGALAESYLNDDNRSMFHNARDYGALYPDEAERTVAYCAPRLDDGRAVDEARRRIALRAGLLRAADAPRLGSLRGKVDRVTPRRIEGWAQSVDTPDVPVCLDIFAGEQLIGQVLANRHRRDLQRAGVGSGQHGFVFSLPTGADIDLDAVSARRSLDGAILALSA